MPIYPAVSNVTGKVYESIENIRSLLVEQVKSPVRWTDCVRYMISNGVNEFVEIGPNKVLTNLVKRINKDVKSIGIETIDEVMLFAKLYNEG